MADEIVCETVSAFRRECHFAGADVWLDPVPGDSVTYRGRTVVYRPPPPPDDAKAALEEWWQGYIRSADYSHDEYERIEAVFLAGRDIGLKQALEKCTARRDATSPHYIGGCREGIDWCLSIMRGLRKVKP